MATNTLPHFCRQILAGLTLLAGLCGIAQAQSEPRPGSIVHRVRDSERLELTVNTSRILSLDQKIPQAQVNNPEVLAITPLSPTQVQISAKRPGVTQVNLWDDKQQVHTIDVVVYGDARELQMILASEFPNAALKVKPISTGVLISGFVDQPEQASRIVQVAEEYYPKVINNITVGGVQQVLLHMKVMEVSRTKLRNLGIDFSQVSGAAGSFATSVMNTTQSTVNFKIVSGENSFTAFLDALRQDDLVKIQSEPTLVTVSGRPAYFAVGGEVGYEVAQGYGTVTVEWKDWGTKIDFVPIVLGHGRLRLEVRPKVSEIDNTNSWTTRAPAIKFRTCDTGIELMAGQTLAIAGLVQSRVESQNRGLPWVSEVPYLGVLFRRVHEQRNEVETLVLVTPEIVEAMEPNEVPRCGPGDGTTTPNDWDFYLKGKIEVPNPCPPRSMTAYWTGPRAMGPAAPVPPEVTSPGAPGVPPKAETVPTPSPSNRTPSPPPPPPVPTDTISYNPATPQNRASRPAVRQGPESLPGFGGPVGYDAN